MHSFTVKEIHVDGDDKFVILDITNDVGDTESASVREGQHIGQMEARRMMADEPQPSMTNPEAEAAAHAAYSEEETQRLMEEAGRAHAARPGLQI